MMPQTGLSSRDIPLTCPKEPIISARSRNLNGALYATLREAVLDKDDLITTAMIYWLTETYLSAAHHYYAARPEPIRAGFLNDRLPVVAAPTGMLRFAGDVFLQPRKWAERYYNLQRWNLEPNGGHFASMENPEALVQDMRAFFRALR